MSEGLFQRDCRTCLGVGKVFNKRVGDVIRCNVCGGTGLEPPAVLAAPVRAHDPETSVEAAASITSDKLRESHQAVLACFAKYGPMTDTQLVARYQPPPQQSSSGLRTRRAELFDAGLLKRFGRRTLPPHRAATVWGLVNEEGEADADSDRG